MADYAINTFGVPRENVVLEECARTTWENTAYSIPLIEQAPSIKIASNTFHARTARKYLAKQSPLLTARLHCARDYVPSELVLAKLRLGSMSSAGRGTSDADSSQRSRLILGRPSSIGRRSSCDDRLR